jgi:hypothetical protein
MLGHDVDPATVAAHGREAQAGTPDKHTRGRVWRCLVIRAQVDLYGREWPADTARRSVSWVFVDQREGTFEEISVIPHEVCRVTPRPLRMVSTRFVGVAAPPVTTSSGVTASDSSPGDPGDGLQEHRRGRQ